MSLWVDPSEVSKHQSPGYTRNIFNYVDFQELVKVAAKTLRKINIKTPFNAIAGIGGSGIPLLGALSYKLKIPMIMVRKETENLHGGFNAMGHIQNAQYVIIDDLISTGATVKRVIEKINEDSIGTAAPVGIMLYAHFRGGDPDKFIHSYEDMELPVVNIMNKLKNPVW